jgi:hypothetical protein
VHHTFFKALQYDGPFVVSRPRHVKRYTNAMKFVKLWCKKRRKKRKTVKMFYRVWNLVIATSPLIWVRKDGIWNKRFRLCILTPYLDPVSPLWQSTALTNSEIVNVNSRMQLDTEIISVTAHRPIGTSPLMQNIFNARTLPLWARRVSWCIIKIWTGWWNKTYPRT